MALATLLPAQELEDALQLLCARSEDEAAAAAADKRRLEGVVKSLEARLAQVQKWAAWGASDAWGTNDSASRAGRDCAGGEGTSAPPAFLR